MLLLGAGVTLATTSYETGMGLSGPTIHLVVLCTLMWARWSRRWRPGG